MTTASKTIRRFPRGLLLAGIGVFVVFGIVAPLMVSLFAPRPRSYAPQFVAADGISRLSLDVATGSTSVTCGSGDEFVLTQEEVVHEWVMERDGDTLKVGARGVNWFFGLDLFFRGKERVTLTIPNTLCQSNLEANLKVSAGQLAVDGNFTTLGIELSAGSATLSGQATSLAAEVSAGELNLNLNGIKTVNAEISAGTIQGALTQVPETVKVGVSAGEVSLNFPAGNYTVNSEVSAGEFTNQLTNDPQGPASRIDVDVSAGSVTLNTSS